MLGHDGPLEWVDTGRNAYGTSVRIPRAWRDDPTKRPSQHAWVIKFEWGAAFASR
jgi:hypothetical protein